MARTPEQSAAIDGIRQRLLAGCDAGEFAAMRCPVCGARLELSAHPRRPVIFVRCLASSVHLGFHAEAAVAPAWWAAHKSDGWLSDA